MSYPISVVLITKNEAQNISTCLASVDFIEDRVVVDSGSTDNTLELAKSLGARVFSVEWMGFGPTKKHAVSLAQNDWVLCLDADEALDSQAQRFIKDLFSSEDPTRGPASAYQFRRESFHMGRWIKHGGWSPDFQLRLFDRRKANWNQALIHEKVELKEGRVETASGKIQHWVFEDLFDQIQTNNRYSTLGAEALSQRGVRFSLMRLIFKPISKFFETYLFKQGFRDGLPGFIIAVGAAYSVFLKFSKLWELEKVKASKDQG
ncbi:glycosyltransferase family 2 protein [bacterium]|nr:glycosyltransferase family 2 protein [bacterium]